MGSGIAQVAAAAGWQVTMRDVSEDAFKRGLDGIRKSLGRFVEKGRLSAQDAEAALDRITPTTDLDAVSDASLVVEAVFERLDVKQDVFRELDRLCPDDAVLASNTSAIPITKIAGGDPAAGVGGRHALLLAGADDGALRTRPRPPHQRRDPGHGPGVRRVGRQDLRSGDQGRSGVRHHPADLGAGRRGRPPGRVRCRHRRGHRHRVQARVRACDGAARDDRPHRRRRTPARDREHLERHGRSEVLPAGAADAGWSMRGSSAASRGGASIRTTLPK